MVDDAGASDAGEGDFVQFRRAGSPAAGAFRCADCGYGVAVHEYLPRCPMCGGTTWEAAPPTLGPSVSRQFL